MVYVLEFRLKLLKSLADRENMKVLLIEDNEDLREAFKEQISFLGHLVVEAHNGLEGLKVLSTQTVDLVISDIQMPQLDGVSFLKEAKSKYPQIPVFIMTGFSPYTEKQILALGASGYFEKDRLDFSSLFSKAS